jgi:uncharacterized protein YjbJ (UPF0337 family)
MKSAGEQQAGGAWKQFKGRLREAWGALSDQDVDRYEGRRDQLLGHIEQKTGEARDSIARKLDQWARDVKYSWGSTTTTRNPDYRER